VTQVGEVDTGDEAAPAPVGRRDPVRWVLGAMVVGWSVLFIASTTRS
jgi:hypothetical protein